MVTTRKVCKPKWMIEMAYKRQMLMQNFKARVGLGFHVVKGSVIPPSFLKALFYLPISPRTTTDRVSRYFLAINAMTKRVWVIHTNMETV